MGLHSLIHNLSTKDAVPAAPAVKDKQPTKKELYRNRFQFGPNLGALFVQERWIDSSLFTDKDGGGSELAALEGSSKSGESVKDMRRKWEDHWSKFVSDDDWKLLKSRGVTAVRLPIGFWSLGSEWCKHTSFVDYAEVYANSWKYVEGLIDKAAEHNIGVLVDFHGLPGGANGDEHSGSSTGKAELWSTARFRDIALSAFEECAKRLKDQENVVGIQLVNEAPWGEDKLKAFYLDAVAKIRKIDSSIPLIISDGWDLDGWRKTIKDLDKSVSSEKHPATTGLVIDTHVYRMFADHDKKRSADEHVNDAPQCIPGDDDVDVMVGEYSCVLSEDSWGKTNGNRSDMEIEYGRRQLECFKHCARSGAYFWTFKFGQGVGGAWDFRYVTEKGGLPDPSVHEPAADQKDALSAALEGHKKYWDNVDSHQDWEHWRFEDGFKQGWEDAATFASFDGSRLGRISAWSTARLAQHIHDEGYSDKVWVYQQAFIQGVNAFQG